MQQSCTLSLGAVDTVQYLTKDELDIIESIIEDLPWTMSETEINDLFWFDDDTLADWLGYESFEDIMNRVSQEELR